MLRQVARTDQEPRVRRRAQCLLVLETAASLRQAARLVGVSTPMLRRWRARFMTDGRHGLADRPRQGRPPKLDTTARALLAQVLEQSPLTMAIR